MDAAQLLTALCASIDAHDWEGMRPLLHQGFSCRYVHTGEVLDADDWVRLNAEYPGFEHLTVEDLVATQDRAVARCRVTAFHDGQASEFQVASFIRVRDGLISELVVVWTDVNQIPPDGTRLG